MKIPNPVGSAALARPHHPALQVDEQVWSWHALSQAVAAQAHALVSDGVKPGDVVAMLGPPSHAWLIALHAIGWVGAAAAPLVPGPTQVVARNLQGLGASHAVVLPGGDPSPLRAAANGTDLDILELSSAPDGPGLAERPWDLEAPRLVLSTSGTTGAPRSVTLSTGQLMLSAFGSAIRLGHLPDDRWLCCLPPHHVAGAQVMLRCAFYGTTVRLVPRFDAAEVARILDGGEVSLVSLVPTMLERVLDAREIRPFPPSLRVILVGGSPCPPRLLARCREIGAPVALTWGMTETASQVATRTPGDLEDRPDVGPPLPFARVGTDDARTLVVHGPLAGHAEHLVTDDVGAVDPQGRVTVRRRRDQVLISGGEKIDPSQVEAAVCSHPQVEEAAVIGLSDPHWGERPVAFLVPRGPAPSDPELIAHCKARLSGFEIPDAFHVRSALPRTESGKVELGSLSAEARRSAREAPCRVHFEGGRKAQVASSVCCRSHPVLERLANGAEQAELPRLEDHLRKIQGWLADDLVTLETDLSRVLEGLEPGDRAVQAARHLLAQPGKRVRPLCVALAARLGSRLLDKDVASFAVAAELVHAATLLHDDVIDMGNERRGAPAARVITSNAASILGGDYLLIEALRRVQDAGRPEQVRGLLDTIDAMVAAEALQVERRGRFIPDEAAYFEVIRGKTAALFRWCLEVGGELGGLPVRERAALAEAGMELGTAFQLTDDLLDICGDPETLGKAPLADLRDGKLTWPVLVACRRDAGLASSMRAFVEGASMDQADLAAQVGQTGAIEATRELATRHARNALSALSSLPASRARVALEAVVASTVHRAQKCR